MRRICLLLCVFSLNLLSGCRSAYIEATITNRSPQSITDVQVDYPSASFGTDSIAPGASFHYRLKVIGSGPVKISYIGNRQYDMYQERHFVGSTLHEGDSGQLFVVIEDHGVAWDFRPQGKR